MIGILGNLCFNLFWIWLVISVIVVAIGSAIADHKKEKTLRKEGPLQHYYIIFDGELGYCHFEAHHEDELIFSIQAYLNLLGKNFVVYQVPYDGCEDVSKWELVGEYYVVDASEVNADEEV